MINRSALGLAILLLSLPLLSLGAQDTSSQRFDLRLPGNLKGVGIEPQLGETVPLDASFRSANGDVIRLGDLFQKGRPVLLSLTYSGCPMLCHLQLDGLVRSLQAVDLTPGEDFEVVNVSIDPTETWQRAQITKRKHVEMYGREETADGWHFLTGDEEQIRRVADAVGFGYQFVRKTGEYAHAAGVVICTGDGKVSRYLNGVDYAPATLRLSLVEASAGEIGSAFDQVLLFCFHYDATEGKYAPAAFRIMQAGGTLTLAVMLILIAPYWRRRRAAKTDSDEGAERGELAERDVDEEATATFKRHLTERRKVRAGVESN